MLRTKLRKARRDRGLTQKTLSVLAGISQPLIAKYELGHKPSINNLRRICEALEVPIDFFNKSTNEKEAIEFDDRFFELMLEKTKKLSLAKKKSSYQRNYSTTRLSKPPRFYKRPVLQT